MRTKALNIDLFGDDAPPKKKFFQNPFRDWPNPTSKRSRVERLLRRVWLFRWDDKRKFFTASGIDWCQTQGYRDQKIARKFPKRNWLKEELPRKHLPLKWKWERISDFVRYRKPGNRHHILNLGLEPGYYDADHKMLHAVFEIVRWYVEVQCAGWQRDEGDHKWYGNRSPEAGVAHLDWEITDCAGTPQGDSAQIKKDVYLWWTVDRPNRIDPHDVYDIVAPKRTSYRDKGLWGVLSDTDPNRTRAMWGSTALEEFYKNEDQEMLSKAVSILHHWWD